jgi:hypothetical protein
MSLALKAHPIGIKFYTNLWRANKDLTMGELNLKFREAFYLQANRKIGHLFCKVRRGPYGAFGAFATLGLSTKFVTGLSGAERDRQAAMVAYEAYGQGNVMARPLK